MKRWDRCIWEEGGWSAKSRSMNTAALAGFSIPTATRESYASRRIPAASGVLNEKRHCGQDRLYCAARDRTGELRTPAFANDLDRPRKDPAHRRDLRRKPQLRQSLRIVSGCKRDRQRHAGAV